MERKSVTVMVNKLPVIFSEATGWDFSPQGYLNIGGTEIGDGGGKQVYTMAVFRDFDSVKWTDAKVIKAN